VTDLIRLLVSCEYVEQAVKDGQEGVVLQLDNWLRC